MSPSEQRNTVCEKAGALVGARDATHEQLTLVCVILTPHASGSYKPFRNEVRGFPCVNSSLYHTREDMIPPL